MTRRYTKRDYSNTIKGKMALMPEYENRCFVCHKKFGRGFAFHHLWYLKTGEVYYKDYKNSNDYNGDLTKLIRKNPKRFLLLCRVHHHYIERLHMVLKNHPNTFKRLIIAIRLTKT